MQKVTRLLYVSLCVRRSWILIMYTVLFAKRKHVLILLKIIMRLSFPNIQQFTLFDL